MSACDKNASQLDSRGWLINSSSVKQFKHFNQLLPATESKQTMKKDILDSCDISLVKEKKRKKRTTEMSTHDCQNGCKSTNVGDVNLN